MPLPNGYSLGHSLTEENEAAMEEASTPRSDKLKTTEDEVIMIVGTERNGNT